MATMAEPAAEQKLGAFGRISKWAAYDSRLSNGAFRVYGVIAAHCNPAGYAWPSHDTIAAALGVSRQMAWRHVQALEAAGYLIVQRRLRPEGGKTHSVYYVPLMTEAPAGWEPASRAGNRGGLGKRRATPENLTSQQGQGARPPRTGPAKPAPASGHPGPIENDATPEVASVPAKPSSAAAPPAKTDATKSRVTMQPQRLPYQHPEQLPGSSIQESDATTEVASAPPRRIDWNSVARRIVAERGGTYEQRMAWIVGKIDLLKKTQNLDQETAEWHLAEHLDRQLRSGHA